MKRFVLFLLSLLLILAAPAAFAQKYKVNMKLGFWADTVGYPVDQQIAQLYKNYLESSPDSIYDNPYWNSAEKKEYHDFDFSRGVIMNKEFPASALFKVYTCYVLKIDKKNDNYYIQSMLFSENPDSLFARFNPAAIMKYYVVKEGSEYKLANSLKYETADWEQKDWKYVSYRFNKNKFYSDSLARLSDLFCDSIMTRFNFPAPKRIHYYVVDGIHEVAFLLGYDHHTFGFAQGRSLNNMIISGNGTVYHPHELVHQLIPQNPKRYHLLEEGFATWLGGSMGNDYKHLSQKYASDYCAIDTSSFHWAWQCGVLNCYALFAIVIDMVHENFNDAAVLQLVDAPIASEDDFYKEFEKVTNWNKEKFLLKWSEKIKNTASVN
jgi:hypothetical protein